LYSSTIDGVEAIVVVTEIPLQRPEKKHPRLSRNNLRHFVAAQLSSTIRETRIDRRSKAHQSFFT
jgi:hypothetical protein